MPSSSRMKKTILVVDRQGSLRGEVAEPLSDFGYACRSSADGSEVLAGTGGATEPDLVVLDLSIPEAEGLSFVRTARSLPALHDLPILVVVPAERVSLVAGFLREGCSDFLVRPVDKRLLYQRVQSLVEGNPRNYRRVPCDVVAEISTGRNAFIGELKEIGEGGASVLLDEPPLEGDLARLAFSLPRQERTIIAGGEVVYNRPSEGKTLCGLKFVILDREGREAIVKFVEGEGKTQP